MTMAPLLLASVFLVAITFAGLIVWRVATRRSAGASLRNATVSHEWLIHHQSEDR
jgi:hypothetical protein